MSHALSAPGVPPGVPGYRTKIETIIGGGADLQLRSLLDRQQYHDPDGEAERAGIPEAAWPLFGLLWPSGQVLAGAAAGLQLRGRRILEVGCGLALASLVIHRRGGDITATDCHPLAGAFIGENLLLNRLPAMKYEPAHWSRPHAGLGLFDLIIGSDLLYDRDQPETLSRFIDRHSSARVEVLIVDPVRGNQPSFSRKMVALGYSHHATRVVALPGGEAFRGHMHRYLRGEAS